MKILSNKVRIVKGFDRVFPQKDAIFFPPRMKPPKARIMNPKREAKNMTVGMLLATILLVLTFSGVLSGAWERLGIRPRTAGAWLLAMLAALLMPDVRLGAARVNPAGWR